MSSGERPIGATKGKQSDTKGLCHPPPPHPTTLWVGTQPTMSGRFPPQKANMCTHLEVPTGILPFASAFFTRCFALSLVFEVTCL